VGGDEDAYRRVEPLLHLLGKQIWRFERTEQASHMPKDINLMLDAAREAGAPLPVIEVAQRLFVDAQSAGYGKKDYSAVVKVLHSQAAK
jgi:3-hydroxyisobutyrate dehydrogenase-like beta-hydroxyacid dehydrogenase